MLNLFWLLFCFLSWLPFFEGEIKLHIIISDCISPSVHRHAVRSNRASFGISSSVSHCFICHRILFLNSPRAAKLLDFIVAAGHTTAAASRIWMYLVLFPCSDIRLAACAHSVAWPAEHAMLSEDRDRIHATAWDSCCWVSRWHQRGSKSSNFRCVRSELGWKNSATNNEAVADR